MEKFLDRIVTVIFVIALVAIVYFVGQYVSKQMLGKGDVNAENVIDDEDEFSDEDDVDDILDNEDSDYYSEDGAAEEDLPSEYNDEIANIMDDVINEAEEAETSNNSSTTAKPQTTSNTTNNNSSEKSGTDATTTQPADVPKSYDDDGKNFMVVAGSFTSVENAQTMSNSLKKEGYTPEIVNFNNSRMHTVVAARYATRASAAAAVTQLKSKKFDCYLHTKRIK